jgi:TldD protein
MPITRRNFVKSGVAAAAVAAMPRPLLVRLGSAPEPIPPIDDSRLKELVGRALEAARAAGASYADVRLTHVRGRNVRSDSEVRDGEDMVAGVRALVNGYWGFAGGGVWSPDEMARLGRAAVALAKTNALGKTRVVELAPAPAIKDGHWVMPVKIDPFDVPPLEIVDFLAGLEVYVVRTLGAHVNGLVESAFFVQESAFGSTVGSYCTQRCYRTSGRLEIVLVKDGKQGGGELDCLTPAGLGWELFTAEHVPFTRDRSLRESIRQFLDEVESYMKLPVRPLDVGRYDTVVDAQGVANLLDGTLAPATQLDRALGYEANAGGTSYINAPLEMMGTYQAGSPLLTVTGNRSEPGGCATVQWDAEGVVPNEITLVKDGVLVDFQTTRESAGWLKEAYAKAGKPFRSHGCASAPDGIYAPLQHAPNLTLAPDRGDVDFDALIAGVTKGIAIKRMGANMDFQCLNGMGSGVIFDIKRGKRVAVIGNAAVLFRAPELWKGLLALGGAASARRYGMAEVKGEPRQESSYSVTAPPALFKQLTYIDPLRKA